MTATRHRPGRKLDHFIGYLRIAVEGEDPRYPISDPLPQDDVTLISRLRAAAEIST